MNKPKVISTTKGIMMKDMIIIRVFKIIRDTIMVHSEEIICEGDLDKILEKDLGQALVKANLEGTLVKVLELVSSLEDLEFNSIMMLMICVALEIREEEV